MWIRKNDKEIRWPPKLNPKKAEKRDRTKYCRFYKDHGHTTKEYRQLKDEIKRMIRDGTLRKFTKKGKEEKRFEPEETTPKTTPNREPVRVIHMITKGSGEG